MNPESGSPHGSERPTVESSLINPNSIRLDASTVCQLRCPSCPTTTGQIERALGSGFLKFSDFKRIIDENPRISKIELSNWGEIFLNKGLLSMLKYAYERNVALFAGNGVNFNTVSDKVLEGIVRYRLRRLKVSIDGASQETYRIYRANGDFARVLENIRKINFTKARYGSHFPELVWQFIVFGHNEHEIVRARSMAEDLNMEFSVKLSWEDTYTEPFSPVKDLETARRETGLGAATRTEYRERYGQEYMLRHCCTELWTSPQINYDGRLLGCPANLWGDYGNVLEDGLMESLNSGKMIYAREMLMGRRPPRDDIPCLHCKAFHEMRKTGNWISESEVRKRRPLRKSVILLENKILGYDLTRSAARRFADIRRLSRSLGHAVRRKEELDPGYMVSMVRSMGRISAPRLTNNVYPLKIPVGNGGPSGWRPYPLFRGSTRGIYDFSCHASVLNNGSCPHPPHTHDEEELLLLLSGEVDLILPRDPTGCERDIHLEPGHFVYYPLGFPHTLRTTSSEPANYLMFKWTARPRESRSRLTFGEFNMVHPMDDAETGFRTRVVFEGPTSYLRKLHCHTSILTPGAAYEPHSDSYDVAIVVVEGEVETIGKRVDPYGVIFYAAGMPHGMRNPGDVTSRYVVFEFHNQR